MGRTWAAASGESTATLSPGRPMPTRSCARRHCRTCRPSPRSRTREARPQRRRALCAAQAGAGQLSSAQSQGPAAPRCPAPTLHAAEPLRIRRLSLFGCPAFRGSRSGDS
eukprot:3931946-Rhodomonas_salina.1